MGTVDDSDRVRAALQFGQEDGGEVLLGVLGRGVVKVIVEQERGQE